VSAIKQTDTGFEVLTAVAMNVAIFWDRERHKTDCDTGYEVLTAVAMNVAIFWEPGKEEQRPNDSKINSLPLLFPEPYITGIPVGWLIAYLHWFLARLIFGHEDGGDIILRNVHTDYASQYSRRFQHSNGDVFILHHSM
jgi:hypothetical protein